MSDFYIFEEDRIAAEQDDTIADHRFDYDPEDPEICEHRDETGEKCGARAEKHWLY